MKNKKSDLAACFWIFVCLVFCASAMNNYQILYAEYHMKSDSDAFTVFTVLFACLMCELWLFLENIFDDENK